VRVERRERVVQRHVRRDRRHGRADDVERGARQDQRRGIVAQRRDRPDPQPGAEQRGPEQRDHEQRRRRGPVDRLHRLDPACGLELA
jgi:hypothetical protein